MRRFFLGLLLFVAFPSIAMAWWSPAPGDIYGPAPGVSTDNAIVLWDGILGNKMKNSTITTPEAGSLNLPNSLYIESDKVLQYSTSGKDLILGDIGLDVDDTSSWNVLLGSGIADHASIDPSAISYFIGLGHDICGSGAASNFLAGNSYENICIGWNTMAKMQDGSVGNFGMGESVLFDLTVGSNNTVTGNYAINDAITTADDNTIYGAGAGDNLIGDSDGNVIIGRLAGPNTRAEHDNQLFIDNSRTDTPLIWGDFDANHVKINGTFEVTPFERHVSLDFLSGLRQNSPDEIVQGTAAGLGFNATNETIYIRWHVPEDWVGTSDATLHIHWFPATTMSDTEDVDWDIEYRSVSTGEDVDNVTATTGAVAYNQSGSGTANEYIYSPITITYNDGNNPLVPHDDVMIKLNRDVTNEQNSYGANAVIQTIHVAYSSNKMSDGD